MRSRRKPAVFPAFPRIGNAPRTTAGSHAPAALFRLLEDCPAKFILLSYSSEGFISYEEMTNFLGRLGHIVTLETPYATFRGSRNLRNRPQNVTEFLFLVERF